MTSLIITDDVVFSLPLLSMILIMSEEYHQELRTSTLSFNAPSRFLSIRIAGFYLLKSFIRSSNIFKEYCVSLQSSSIQNSLRAMKRRQLLVCLIILDLTFVFKPQPSQENTFLIGRVLGVLLLVLLHPVFFKKYVIKLNY